VPNRIAVIGSGIAGLTSAWLAERAGSRVTIFEKQPVLGMDAHSVELSDLGYEASSRIDLPPRMFNQDEWPCLTALYGCLGVETLAVDASKSFSVVDSSDGQNFATWLSLGSNYGDSLRPSLLFNQKARRVASETKRMQKLALATDLVQMPIDQTFGEYVKNHHFDEAFVYEFLFAGLAATVFTCSYSAIENYPAKIVLASLLNQFDRSPLQRTAFGTCDVVKRLTAKIDDVRLGCSVNGIRVGEGQVLIETIDGSATGEEFDHLVIATQANAAADLLPTGCADLKTCLSGFRYEDVPVVVHSDCSFMPTETKNQKCFNFVSNSDRQDAMCTIDLSRFYSEREMPRIFQTIRPVRDVAAGKTLVDVTMQRPVVSRTTQKSIDRLQELQRRTENRVWFCGSYAADGVPLLESGVVSAMNWAEQMGWPKKTSYATSSLFRFS
jgi:predicted NAD/FAD-binding protein